MPHSNELKQQIMLDLENGSYTNEHLKELTVNEDTEIALTAEEILIQRMSLEDNELIEMYIEKTQGA